MKRLGCNHCDPAMIDPQTEAFEAMREALDRLEMLEAKKAFYRVPLKDMMACRAALALADRVGGNR